MSESKGSDSDGKLQGLWDEYLVNIRTRNAEGMGAIFAEDISYSGFAHGTPAPNKIEGKEGVIEFLKKWFGMIEESLEFAFEDQTVVDEENMKTVLCSKDFC